MADSGMGYLDAQELLRDLFELPGGYAIQKQCADEFIHITCSACVALEYLRLEIAAPGPGYAHVFNRAVFGAKRTPIGAIAIIFSSFGTLVRIGVEECFD